MRDMRGLFNAVWPLIVYFVEDVRSPLPHKMQPTEMYDREYWYSQAQQTLERRLEYANENQPFAKNVIIFIGDGMSVATTTAARILNGQRRGENGEENQLAWDTFPAVALAKTYNVDAQTGESSACATALFCGVKTNYEILGLDATAKFNRCSSAKHSVAPSIFDWANHAGKWTGFVTTSRVSHATPAALYSHSPSRYWEDDSRIPPKSRRQCNDIAMQLIENEPGKSVRVILGGGRRHFVPLQSSDPVLENREGRRLDGRNLAQEWLRNKKENNNYRASLVYNKSQLDQVNLNQVDYLMGLFEYSHMSFEWDRVRGENKKDEPSIADMTRAALAVLRRSSNGFVLVVEGGRIDHAHHFNNPFRALDDTLALEKAVRATLEMINLNETLVLVTADHGHVMTMGGQATPRGHSILGAEPSVSDMDGLPYSTLLYGSGPGHVEPRVTPIVNGTVEDVLHSNVDAVHAAAAPRHWATHGGEDVAVYAIGPMAITLFGGTVEQSYIPHALAYAACLGRYTSRCKMPIPSSTAKFEQCEKGVMRGSPSNDITATSSSNAISEIRVIASRSAAESARTLLDASSIKSDDALASSASHKCFSNTFLDYWWIFYMVIK